ncbi:MAG: hypothetical protein B1H04_04940 [Planctomycetales bacterium 4484_123]|nr:MAG: hypothetical protein B1H04_04940 [Planctomycetales bacterium 4484_123]
MPGKVVAGALALRRLGRYKLHGMIPIRTDRRNEHTPWVNYALIAANVLVFVFVQKMGRAYGSQGGLFQPLHPDEPTVQHFFTSMFMHGGWDHLLGNMLFLWVFGNAVNDAFGHLGYLAFYLAGGLTAGVGYVVLSGSAPVLGASGAISAVTGAFLVLFPRVRVTVLFIFFYIVPFEITSLVFLLFQLIWNLYYTVFRLDGGGVAYAAHAAGYVFGIGIVALLLWGRLLPRDVYDLLSLIRTWRRRLGYRRLVSGGYDAFSPGPGRLRRPPPGPGVAPALRPVQPTASPREQELRARIAVAHRQRDFATAAGAYLELVQLASDAVLPLPQQLDVANYLMSTHQYPAAADAYERFLRHYSNYEYVGDIRLMLGLLYSRYLRQDERAEMYLARAVPDLFDASKLELAQAELAEVRRRLGR